MGLFDIFKNRGENSQQPVPSQTAQPAKKIMIVEDEQVLADALKLQLNHDGFNVIYAENGQVGLEMAQAQKPDVILLDLLMPVMDGKTMLAKLREIPEFKQLPVIVLTNAGEIDNMRETETYNNAVAFLIKSNVTTQEISDMVKEVLKGKL